MNPIISLTILSLSFGSGNAFAPVILKSTTASKSIPSSALKMADGEKQGGIFGAIGGFFEELDAFVDDATNRRLGNGSAFYGKRKSGFYGEDDLNRKMDKDMPDPTEDYQGPKKAGYFTWVPDEDGQMRPVTRLKGKNIERNPNYWDKVYNEEEE
mmetsp:Transcript_2447/g.3443  ORF Transcript_2447/g.3443 Transcript_2447/m.3443 type:complete len:155 (+) Transcript_2447:76-540(+)